jgi:hypothetical protein
MNDFKELFADGSPLKRILPILLKDQTTLLWYLKYLSSPLLHLIDA